MPASSTVAPLAFLSIVGLLLYWHILEKRHSRADQSKSQHHPWIQKIIRWLPQLFAIMLLLQLLRIFSFDLPVFDIVKESMVGIGLIIFWAAAAIAIWARQTLGLNWAHAADYQVMKKQELVTSGPYRVVRHPIYTAFLLMFIGIELVVASWLIVLTFPLLWFFVWQAKKEELLLTRSFGQAYRDYARRTGMLLPRIWPVRLVART